jgi:hypothetical protein
MLTVGSQVTHNEGMASLRMALPLVLRDYRRVGAQSGDLSLGVDMGDAQLPSRIFTSDPVGGALRSGRPLSDPQFERDREIWEKWKSRSNQ